MSFSVNQRVIKSLCGQFAYEKGAAIYRARNVLITSEDDDHTTYEALVTEKTYRSFRVMVEMDPSGQIHATCSCPPLSSYDKYCKHIAATLLQIQEVQLDNTSTTASLPSSHFREPNITDNRLHTGSDRYSSKDRQVTIRLLDLFREAPLQSSTPLALFENRDMLEAEFVVRSLSYGNRKAMFGIEMKVGPKRLYVVSRINDFLDRFERQECYEFSRHFTYDPAKHRLQKEHAAIVAQLLQIHKNEKMLRNATTTILSHMNGTKDERMLLIPPVSWEALFPLLVQAPSVRLEHKGKLFERVDVSDKPLPLHFAFDQSGQEDEYLFSLQGLEQITVMEGYGTVVSSGQIHHVKQDQCSKLLGLQSMVELQGSPSIHIASDQMESFLEKVVPGLRKLGKVHITEAVSSRILQTPLRAKLFLDRIKDRLVGALEFHYGELVINPLEENSGNRGSDLLLLRDGEKERQILSYMDESQFTKTEAGYYMENEEAEFDFLYNVIPQLEKLLNVYATSAVKTRLHTGHTPPKVSVELDERTKWLEVNFEMESIPVSEIRSLLKSIEEKRKYFRLSDGSLLPLQTDAFTEIHEFMHESGFRIGDFAETGSRIPIVRGLALLPYENKGKSVKFGRSFRKLLGNMRNPDNLDFPIPDSLTHVLRDYQAYGYQWMKTLAHYHFGGILADDMGLGKTLQSIAFLQSVLGEIRSEKQPAIIVSPASLVYNWRNEMAKFAPELRTAIVDGSKAERMKILDNLADVDVVITSYPLLRRDLEQYSPKLFHTLFLDEAQFFKNYTTLTAQSVKAIQARHRFALTGTPIENSLDELWSIFDAVFPELFVSRKMFKELSREAVAKRVRPFLLRRIKSDVLHELPEKIETLQHSELLPEQKKLYLAYLAKLQVETLKHLNDDSFQQNRIKILAGLTRLRQLCCHPALFVEGYEGSSAKFEQLFEVLAECQRAGKRVLLFSQFTEMLGLIAKQLGDHGVPFFYLDGSTPASERVELCTRFNEGDRDLFLMSLKAGGTGLNLTGADTVILYDLWWNPAVEQQAADRAHRIGQKKVVQVIRLVSQGTVEEKMFALQQKKKNLVDEVIQAGQEPFSALSEEDIRELLSIQ